MIPVNEPVIGDAEIIYVNQCLTSGWISSVGQYVIEFESKWATYCGCEYGIAVTNGTHALELAVSALEFEPNSEIIMPSFTIISCALAAIKNRLKPVFVDSHPYDWCIDINKIEEAITPRTVAIMPVHIYGYPANMIEIMRIANKHNLYIIEDAAEAHGAKCFIPNEKTWRRVGGIGHLGCFSFYANKIVSCGEGGMVITNNKSLAEKMRSSRNLCFGTGNQRFVHTGLGNNFRMTNIQAAIGLGQIHRINQILERKKYIAEIYNYKLRLLDAFQLPPNDKNSINVYWMYGLVSLDKKKPASYFIDGLQKRGIDSRPFFTGLHKQPTLETIGDFRVCDNLSQQGFYIPSGISLSDGNINDVCKAIEELV